MSDEQPVRISLRLLKQLVQEQHLRVISSRQTDYGTSLWLHLNDMRFVDWDKLIEHLAKYNIFINEQYDGDINEIRFLQAKDE